MKQQMQKIETQMKKLHADEEKQQGLAREELKSNNKDKAQFHLACKKASQLAQKTLSG